MQGKFRFVYKSIQCHWLESRDHLCYLTILSWKLDLKCPVSHYVRNKVYIPVSRENNLLFSNECVVYIPVSRENTIFILLHQENKIFDIW